MTKDGAKPRPNGKRIVDAGKLGHDVNAKLVKKRASEKFLVQIVLTMG